jgi:hypothetical protein
MRETKYVTIFNPILHYRAKLQSTTLVARAQLTGGAHFGRCRNNSQLTRQIGMAAIFQNAKL